MNKSYVLAKLIDEGFSVHLANEFYNVINGSGLSAVALTAAAKGIIEYAPPVRFRSPTQVVSWWATRAPLVEWVDVQPIDDYTKSVFLEQIIRCNSLCEATKEAYKREVEDFIKFVQEEKQ